MNGPLPRKSPVVRVGTAILSKVGLEDAGRRLYQEIRRRRALQHARISGTSLCRARLARFCVGSGVDLGFGGDPINDSAVRIDLPNPYTSVGRYLPQLSGDAANLVWFRDGTLDYVFSSHLLEDFVDTKSVLCEWLRVLRSGGLLILYCPDEQRYRAHCARTAHPYNPNHKHDHFSLAFVRSLLAEIGGTASLHENPDVDIYSWELVVKKISATPHVAE